MNRFLACLSLCALLMLPAGCGNAEDGGQAAVGTADSASYSTELFAMDTVMTLTAYGANAPDALSAAQAEIERLDALFSISSESGDILPLNQTGEKTVAAETAALIERACDISEQTDGLFDITVAPVMEAWGFTTGDYRVPDAQTLAQLLENVDYHRISMDEDRRVTLAADTEIDLGGIAKGYTSSSLMELFADAGVNSAIVSLGGNVQTLGHKPDGSLWRVAIQDPTDASNNFAVIEVADKAVITSGGYQRYFDQDGQRYHHIIDPRTGYPSDSGLLSVTIVSEDGTLADGLSTSLFIMGKEQAVAFWQAHRTDFDAVLVTEDGEVTITAGLEDCFSMTDGSTPEVVH